MLFVDNSNIYTSTFMKNVVETLVVSHGTRSWDKPVDVSDCKFFMDAAQNHENEIEVSISGRDYGCTTAYQVSSQEDIK